MILLCAEDCGTMYGNLEGTEISSATTGSAGDCCNSCKSTSGCSAWNFCYCDLGCAGAPKGTCTLKSMNNAFYPRHALTCEGNMLSFKILESQKQHDFDGWIRYGMVHRSHSSDARTNIIYEIM